MSIAHVFVLAFEAIGGSWHGIANPLK